MTNTYRRATALAVFLTLTITGCRDSAGEPFGLEPAQPGFAKAVNSAVADVVVGDLALGPDAPALVSTCAGAATQPGWSVTFGKTRCLLADLSFDGVDYQLTDDVVLAVELEKGKGGRITHVRLNGQDVDGDAGIWHNTDLIPVEQPVTPTTRGFTLHVHARNVPVYRWNSHLPRSGQRVAVVGYISIGDIVYSGK